MLALLRIGRLSGLACEQDPLAFAAARGGLPCMHERETQSRKGAKHASQGTNTLILYRTVHTLCCCCPAQQHALKPRLDPSYQLLPVFSL